MSDPLPNDVQHIPVIAEEAHVFKRVAETERVRVRTVPEAENVVVREALMREEVEVTRVPVDQEVAVAPPVRTEGDVTIVPVLEERLVIEKRLVLVEELHLRRRTTAQEVSLPTTLRRTRVEVTREPLQQQEKI